MTIELLEYKCPACGHFVGEEEYVKVKSEINKIVQHKLEEQIDEIKGKHEQELYEYNKKYELELKEQEEKHKDELITKVNQQVQLQIDKILDEQRKEFEIKLSQKETEKNAFKIQVNNEIDKKITEALEKQEEKFRQQKFQDQLKWTRIQKRNEELQKTLDNVPCEFKGEVGEIMLCDELTRAFPQYKFTPKTVGVRMPDVIQNIVTESGELISTPILWDMKTGENITPKDIEKAKIYKEKYNTDYCFIVSANSIKKNSKYYKTELIGKRDGVILVHRKLAVAVAEFTRNFLIEKSKLIVSNDGRASKQTKLYDYITSSARFRMMQEKMKQKLRLLELQIEEEKQVKERWNDMKKIIQKIDELDKEDQDTIDSITQAQEYNNEQI